MEADDFTIKEKFISVDNGHKLYTQLWGNNASKLTFVFLHGGPGSGCSDTHKQLFDPARHRVIFFDQRGAGRSTPAGSLLHNTTDKLLEDINEITNYYQSDELVLVGGSWGSTLALAYALEYPDKLRALVIRGIFMGSQAEIDFLDKGRYKDFFPEVWQDFVSSVPEQFSHSPASYHTTNILNKDRDLAKKSAYAYSRMEYALLGIDDRRKPADYDSFDPNGTIIEVSYLKNLCYMTDNHLLDNAHKINTPVWIVQGRYDAICPPTNAYKLHQELPDSRVTWTTAGHSGSDRANYDAVKAILSALI